MARYAISDIHGCFRTFKKALREINLSRDDTLVILGDYIDRGLDSKGVVDYIIELQEEGYNIIPLKGNHEDFLLDASSDKEVYKSWMWNGGAQTLESYGFFFDHNLGTSAYEQFSEFIPQKHWDWYRSLKTVHEMDDFVFVHGGLDFQHDDPIKDTPDFVKIWERIYRTPGNKRKSLIGNRVLVTGHTPTHKDVMCEMANGEDLITIDRGCVFDSSGYGYLAVLCLDDLQFRFIKNIDTLNRD